MKFKLDKNMIGKHIEVFKDENGRDPYFICNKQTYETLPDPDYKVVAYTPSSWNVLGEEKKPEKPKPAYLLWQTIKVFIDDDLPTGEVIFA